MYLGQSYMRTARKLETCDKNLRPKMKTDCEQWPQIMIGIQAVSTQTHNYGSPQAV